MPLTNLLIRVDDRFLPIAGDEIWSVIQAMAREFPLSEAARLVLMNDFAYGFPIASPQVGVYHVGNLGNLLRDFGFNIVEGWDLNVPTGKPWQIHDAYEAPEPTTYRKSYGVADSVAQALDYFAEALESPDRGFVLGYTEVHREQQPERWGWRWHKWGPYIGDRTPQHEYIADETAENRMDGTSIDHVICFHLYEILGGEEMVPVEVREISEVTA